MGTPAGRYSIQAMIDDLQKLQQDGFVDFTLRYDNNNFPYFDGELYTHKAITKIQYFSAYPKERDANS